MLRGTTQDTMAKSGQGWGSWCPFLGVNWALLYNLAIKTQVRVDHSIMSDSLAPMDCSHLVPSFHGILGKATGVGLLCCL